MLTKLKDGTTVVIEKSRNAMPPGSTGQSQARGSVWWKIPGDDYWRSGARSLSATIEIANFSDNLKEFQELLVFHHAKHKEN